MPMDSQPRPGIAVSHDTEEKMMKFKLREAEKFDTKRLKRKAIWGWLRLYK